MEDFKYGLYFPIVLDQGKPVPPGLLDSVDSSLRNILTNPLFVRNFTPSFGSLLHLLLGRPLSASVIESARVYVRLAINQWEQRLAVSDILVETDPESGKLFLKVEGVITSADIQYAFQVHL